MEPWYQAWLNAVLASVTIALAVLAMFVAGLSIWGYRVLTKAACRKAEQAAQETIEKILSELNIREMVATAAKAAGDQVYADLSTLPLQEGDYQTFQKLGPDERSWEE